MPHYAPGTRPRRSALLTNSVTPFDPAFHELLTPGVRQASDEHRQALVELQARRATVTAAREQLAAAQNADGASAHFAVQAGKQPPAATAPKAADQLERAQRAVAAAEQIARDSQNVLLRIVLEQLPTLRAAVLERQEHNRATAEQALDTIAGALREADALNVLLRELDEHFIQGKAPHFEPLVPRRRGDPAEEALNGIRGRLATAPQPG